MSFLANRGSRIVRIRQYYGSPSRVVLDVKLETVDVGGVPMRLTAVPDSGRGFEKTKRGTMRQRVRSEEHTSELQSPCNLVCRLLLEKKKRLSAAEFDRTYAHMRWL